MRDPNRIDIYCNKLAELWKKYPDMRFGQLINNFQNSIHNDGYYIEDEEYFDKLEQVVKSWEN